MSNTVKIGVLAAVLAVSASASSAAVIRVDEGAFLASAGLITFSEFALGTINPMYVPSDYGGDASAPDVHTGGYFVGQSLSANPGVDCPGASASGCISGSPTGPLAIDAGSPNTFIVGDGSNPTSPVLSGSPLFNGPIALTFSIDQYGVGFDGGYFNGIASTGITAFARDGSLLGTVTNTGLGIEFLGLVSSEANIAGVFLDLVGAEPAGFAIDNVRFGVRGQVVDPSPVPLPAGLPLLVGALALLGLARRRYA